MPPVSVAAAVASKADLEPEGVKFPPEHYAALGKGTATGGFKGPERGRPLAKCDQIPTDGRVRLKERARLTLGMSPISRWADVSSRTPAHCPQRPGRDYERSPIVVFYPGQGNSKKPDGRFDCQAFKILECPVPCVVTAANDKRDTADVMVSVIPGASATKTGVCPLQKQALFSMENELYYPSLQLKANNMHQYEVLGTTRLDSDVPLGYGGWYDFNYLEPPQEKTAKAMAVAVISNCGGTTEGWTT